MSEGLRRRGRDQQEKQWGSRDGGRPSRLPSSVHVSGSGGAFCSSVHTSWLPTITEGHCLQMAPWEPVGLKFELVTIPFIKMKT